MFSLFLTFNDLSADYIRKTQTCQARIITEREEEIKEY